MGSNRNEKVSIAETDSSNSCHKWVVFLSSYLVMMLTVGYMFSQGPLFVMIMRRFGSSRADTAIIQSCTTSCFMGSGFFHGMVIHKLGPRRVGMFWSLVGVTFVLASVFATSVTFLVFTLGIGYGLSLSSMFIGCATTVGQHFEGSKSSPIVMSVLMTGGAVGGVLYPYLLQYLEDWNGLPGVLMVVAGLNLHMFAFTILWSPVSKARGSVANSDTGMVDNGNRNSKEITSETSSEETADNNPLDHKHAISDEVQPSNVQSNGVVNSNRPPTHVNEATTDSDLHNTTIPYTAARETGMTEVSVTEEASRATHTLSNHNDKNGYTLDNIRYTVEGQLYDTDNQQRWSYSEYTNYACDEEQMSNGKSSGIAEHDTKRVVDRVDMQQADIEKKGHTVATNGTIHMPAGLKANGHSRYKRFKGNEGCEKDDEEIHCGKNTTNPQYKRFKDDVDAVVGEDDDEQLPAKNVTILASLKHLGKQKVFRAYVLGTAITLPIVHLLPLFLVDIFIDKGFTEANSSLAVVVYSAFGGLGRLFPGIFMQVLNMPPLGVSMMACLIELFGILGIIFMTSLEGCLTIISILGCGMGMVTAAVSVTTQRLFGSEHLSNGIGILMTSAFFGSISGGPISGYVRDQSNSYTVPLYCYAATNALGFCMFLLGHVWNNNLSKSKSLAAL